MCPCTGARGEIATAGVPLNVRNTVVVGGPKKLDSASPLSSRVLLRLIHAVIEVQVPEFELRLARRANGGENDVTTSR